ncbi:MAG: hypothetical protein HGA44_13005 [Cellulomonadaceae bacterium]|nr:hypothetical protein [Cellulomonadaceae bacterium]
MALWKRDPRVMATQRAAELVSHSFGSPATAETEADFELAADADEFVAAVLGGLRRDGISTSAVLWGRTLGPSLLSADGITDDQRAAVRGLLDVLASW